MDIVMDKEANIKAQDILDQANRLILTVKESFQNGIDLHEIEKNLFDMVLTMGHQALELLFELCGSGDMGPSVCLEDGRDVRRQLG